MPAQASKNPNLIVASLTLTALALMVAAYFSPIWWVALTAPNYPKDAFPDGIRIHFHFNGVFNGCTAAGAGSRLGSEVLQQDLGEGVERYNPILDEHKDVNKGAAGLDCVHEMNTINHYVGMYPIESGAPVERPMAKFIVAFFATMLVAFVATKRGLRLALLGVGFTATAVWMLTDLYVLGHLDAFAQHYMDSVGYYFKEPARLQQWMATLKSVTGGVAVGLVAAMLVVVVGVWKRRGFTLLLALVPALLPLYFVADYAGWLWFFGHNLNSMGAFTVKPFMPTVFGEGKVAQFSTYSYPYYGYAMLVAVMACLLPAVLIRRKQLRDGSVE